MIQSIETLDHESLLSLLEQSEKEGLKLYLLCANNRQARQLSFVVAEQRPHLLDVLRCSSADAWLQAQWSWYQQCSPATFDACYIDGNQSAQLWDTLLEQTSTLPPLVNKAGLAASLQEAWQLVRDYQISTEQLLSEEQEEAVLLNDLGQAYERRCRELNVVDKEQAALFLSQQVESAADANSHCLLYGFADISPLFWRLLTHCFSNLSRLALVKANKRLTIHKSLDADSELHYAAYWAEQCLQKNPSSSIAVVVPDLHKRADVLKKSFNKHFNNCSYLFENKEFISSFFDVSIARPLHNEAIVRCALDALSLASVNVEKQLLLTILRSNYCLSGFNAVSAQLCAYVEQCSDGQVDISELLTKLDRVIDAAADVSEADGCLEEISCAAESIKKGLLALRQLPRLRHSGTIASWVDHYLSALGHIAWPGSQSLASTDYQICNAFLASLAKLAASEAVSATELSFTQFKKRLQAWMQRDIAQVEVPNPGIRVMGLMEAVGLRFDHCLVLGLTEQALPQSPKPTPFIPLAVQKELNMARCSVERELFYAKSMLDDLVACSSEIELSYFTELDGSPLHVSPLLERYRQHAVHGGLELGLEESSAPSNAIDTWRSDAREMGGLVRVPVGQAPSLEAGARLHGGAYMFDLQWANPLYCFFKYRLGFDTYPSSGLGLNAAERGSLLHSALANLYSRFPSQSALQNLVQHQTLETEITKACKEAVAALRSKALSYSPLVSAYEYRRLQSAIRQFVERDLQREQMFVCEQLESLQKISFSGHELHLRVDRMDLVAGEYVVLDYKTGKQNLRAMLRFPLSDYQLALYSFCVSSDALAAMAFIKVDEKASTFEGVCADQAELGIDGLNTLMKLRSDYSDWSQALTSWQDQAHKLATEVIEGFAPYWVRNISKMPFYAEFECAVRDEEKGPIHE
ncbi:PD-(D/E)XK nuclease family protein [Agaribacterium sp. ZY112]|uniref:PD-(D/E)XK nuclease family protein n=1 Tax=Agaribacterium sp. ZY112 TaxID=3233574 RepID=UPI003525541F